ncbi:MAG TPA: choice-of-anchor tandem repeat GloVer-containing protein [Candidatus Babeliales bacterium]|nr:choice-of-anchor tandem repeat GloVer-containing protein [Candidatus Babeliales bacterium]
MTVPNLRPKSVSYRVLYSFGQFGKADDGAHPLAGLISVGSEFYGTTSSGGITNAACAYGCGTVFRVNSAGREKVIYRFKGGSDGDGPSAGLITINGALYGTTSYGGTGTACSGGCGTVFALDTNGRSHRVLYSFAGEKDGAYPMAGLTPLDGKLYGTTLYGGIVRALCTFGCGTIFSVGTNGAENVIHRFGGGKDGANSVAGLLAFGGSLYGVAQYGGVSSSLCSTGCGTIFRVTTAGVLTTLHLFKYSPSSSDGAFPSANLVAVSGELYGTTLSGGEDSDGTVFKASPVTGAETVLHSFNCCATVKDGAYPLAPLTYLGGALYGTTRNGGGPGDGTVFEVSSSGESVLYSFTGKPDGAAPLAGLAASSGVLYGTSSGGGSEGLGTVFALTP